MGIELEEPARTASTPVVKRQRIGEQFVGAIVKVEQRSQTKLDKDGTRVEVLKPNGKPRQELVVHCLAMPQNTAEVSLGDERGVPNPGDPVRLILKGKSFGEWIDARKTHRAGKLNVGDVVVQKVTHAQAYDANGAPKGAEITDQAAADAIPRGTSVGFYGPVTVHEPKDAEWVTKAEDAYRAATAIPAADALDDEDLPF